MPLRIPPSPIIHSLHRLISQTTETQRDNVRHFQSLSLLTHSHLTLRHCGTTPTSTTRCPAGGFYSSINDMRCIGFSILNSALLPPAQTRRRMKPVSFTSNPTPLSVRRWEVARSPSRNRASWMYTKSGDIGLYSSQVALLPDWDAMFTGLAAGRASQTGHANVRIISDMLAATFVPALEATARAEAKTVYAGAYTGGTNSSSTLTVVVDDRPGLGTTCQTESGTDIFPLITTLLEVTPAQPAQGPGQREVVSVSPEEQRRHESWRAV